MKGQRNLMFCRIDFNSINHKKQTLLFTITLFFPMFSFDHLKILENQRFSDVFRRIKGNIGN